MKKDKLGHIKLKENSFKAPKGYFETVEDAMFSKLSAEKFPKKEGFKSPDSYFDTIENAVLSKIKEENKTKQTGFKAPDSYLDTVEDTILNKLKTENKEPKVINFGTILLKRFVPIAAAASLLLFIFLNYNAESTNINKVASTEIEEWIDNDLITFEAYEIAEVYEDVELESPSILPEDELLDYLNGMDVESLLIEN